jgi:hypothetical protein
VRLVVVPDKNTVDKAIADWIVSALEDDPYFDVESIHA